MSKAQRPLLIRTSISIDHEVFSAGKRKADANGQSFSSYVNVLIRRNLGIAKEVRRAS